MLDIICLTLVALAAVRGYRKGIIIAVFALVGIILGTIIAMKLSGTVALWLFKDKANAGWVPLVTYLILFFGVVWLVRWGAKLIEGAAKTVMLGLANRLAGALLYALLAAFILSAVLYLAGGAGMLSADTISGSKTYPYIAQVAPWVFNHIGTVLPFVRNTFTDLQEFFAGPEPHVGTH